MARQDNIERKRPSLFQKIKLSLRASKISDEEYYMPQSESLVEKDVVNVPPQENVSPMPFNYVILPTGFVFLPEQIKEALAKAWSEAAENEKKKDQPPQPEKPISVESTESEKLYIPRRQPRLHQRSRPYSPLDDPILRRHLEDERMRWARQPARYPGASPVPPGVRQPLNGDQYIRGILVEPGVRSIRGTRFEEGVSYIRGTRFDRFAPLTKS